MGKNFRNAVVETNVIELDARPAKTFEFTGEEMTVRINGRDVLLRRIMAKNHLAIRNGEVGGWIEKSSNIADRGWVSGNAIVCGDSIVTEDARVENSAVIIDSVIKGRAHIKENAVVINSVIIDGMIYGSAKVEDSTVRKSHIHDVARIESSDLYESHCYEKARVIGSKLSMEYLCGLTVRDDDNHHHG